MARGGIVKRLFSCGGRSFPADTDTFEEEEPPKEGHVRVCVGRRCSSPPTRFELEANYLNHPLFEDLLRMSVEEFGYSYDGALRIACDVDLFLHLLHLLKSSDPAVHYMEFHDLAAKFYGSGEGK